jgi:hypothetical protein
MHAIWARANWVAIKQLSVGELAKRCSSCSVNRVTATEEGKQQSVSVARQQSGAFSSPHLPEQGKAPPQQM